tara:strand:+ start:1604 stop:2674 length:1071 start_codon:yes stop_codon:yes gene_type:complete
MAYTTIDNPELHFQTKLYTGTGSSNSITLDGDEDMAPDLVWLKKRSAGGGHYLTDTVRGATKTIYPDGVDAEGTVAQALTAFASDGFTVGTDSGINVNTGTHVAWCWKANGTGSSNTDGTINTAATSANTTAGFSIVSYTSNGSSSQTVGHGLGAVPQCIFSKNRDSTSSSYNYWTVYHHSNASANDKKFKLNTNDAASTTNEWGDTDPTSSVYSLHSSGDGTTNVSTNKIISYVWTGIQGYSKFGKYVGNGSADGTYVYTGFRPAFVLFKGINSNREWILADNKRDPINEVDAVLYGNTTDLEGDSDMVDFLSNGFKCIHASGPGTINTSGETYVYMAIAENPFVNSNGIPVNAR